MVRSSGQTKAASTKKQHRPGCKGRDCKCWKDERNRGATAAASDEAVDSSKTSEFINAFPLLAEGVTEHYDILVGESVRSRQLLLNIERAKRQADARNGYGESRAAAHREASQHALYDFLRRKTAYRKLGEFEEVYPVLISAVKDARASVDGLISTDFPEPLKLELEMVADVESEIDPAALAQLCYIRGDDLLSRRTRLEARRQLTIAQIYFDMRRQGDSPEDLDRDMTEFDSALKERYFLPHHSACYEIIADLDPDDCHRVKRLGFNQHASGRRRISSSKRVVLYPGVRFLPGDIPVLFETRPKKDAPFKLIRKNQRDTRRVADLCGAKFVFFSDEDLFKGVERMRCTLASMPGTVFGEVSNIMRAGRVDPTNKNSHEEFRAWKWFARFADRYFELQFMLVGDWLNERCSHGRENHAHYKSECNIRDLYPKLFPSSLYLDWTNPAILRSLHRLQQARIWS